MADELNSRDGERLALLEQKVELLLCLHCGVAPIPEDRKAMGEEAWGRYVHAAELLQGYYGHSYIATGEGEFSALPVAYKLSEHTLPLAPDSPLSHEPPSPGPVQPST
jgi:hypothetical protein